VSNPTQSEDTEIQPAQQTLSASESDNIGDGEFVDETTNIPSINTSDQPQVEIYSSDVPAQTFIVDDNLPGNAIDNNGNPMIMIILILVIGMLMLVIVGNALFFCLKYIRIKREEKDEYFDFSERSVKFEDNNRLVSREPIDFQQESAYNKLLDGSLEILKRICRRPPAKTSFVDPVIVQVAVDLDSNTKGSDCFQSDLETFVQHDSIVQYNFRK
jgi:flagellar basal body-associated protein FliL